MSTEGVKTNRGDNGTRWGKDYVRSSSPMSRDLRKTKWRAFTVLVFFFDSRDM